MINFKSREKKNDVLLAARKMKPNGIFFNENLIPTRASILFFLRKVKKLHPSKVNGCGSYDGRVYAWLNSGSADVKNRKVFVNSISKLDELLMNKINMKSRDIQGQADI